ncbi:MAG TPA: T9SS type A sorting domain-containing protein, partial [Ignavibacteria bacterium]|nr:T9SS type A sorting domain-containing protein [Ignavibacteria bacterium]
TNNNAPTNYVYTAIAISKNNLSDILYFAASSTSNGAPKLYKLENARSSTTAAINLSTALSGAGTATGSYISSIAVNPDNSNEIMVVVSNYAVPSIFYSSDGGNKFVNIEGNLANDSWGGTVGPSVRSAGILPDPSGTVYLVGTSTGLYSTTNVNTTFPIWRIEGDQIIGNVIVDYISLRKVDKYVAIGTHGRGIFTGTYTGVTAVNNENQLPVSYMLSQNYPNPFNPSTTINFALPQSGNVQLTLFDALGRKVKDIVNQDFSAGNHSVNFNAASLSSGVYFYRIQANNFVRTKKMILLR